MPTSRRPGRPGRPARTAAAADGAARRRLLDAAARRFAESGYAATSLRAVAREAGVTPAMVAYYFDDKWGLLEAVLLEGLELLLGALQDAVAKPDDPGSEGSPGAGGSALGGFVAAYLGVVTAHPWIPRIIVQEVISRDSSLRELFVRRFANRALAIVGPMLAAEVQAGRLRRDLDTRLTTMSVIGMCVFPYLAQPLLGPLLDYRIDQTFAAEFIPHTLALLERGVGAQA